MYGVLFETYWMNRRWKISRRKTAWPQSSEARQPQLEPKLMDWLLCLCSRLFFLWFHLSSFGLLGNSQNVSPLCSNSANGLCLPASVHQPTAPDRTLVAWRDSARTITRGDTLSEAPLVGFLWMTLDSLPVVFSSLRKFWLRNSPVSVHGRGWQGVSLPASAAGYFRAIPILFRFWLLILLHTMSWCVKSGFIKTGRRYNDENKAGLFCGAKLRNKLWWNMGH